jgi:phosphate-selective porin OprO/OprP
MKPSCVRLLQRSLLVALAAMAFRPAARADEADDIRQLREQIQLLEKKLTVLEQKDAARDRLATAATAPTPATVPVPTGAQISIGSSGLRAVSPDGTQFIHLGALVQLDSRVFFGDGGGVLNNGFVLRRARLYFDGNLDPTTSFQFVPDFGGISPVSIYDANFSVNLDPEVQFKFGKFKSPIGLEQLQQDAYTAFAERSLATNLVPNRDLGVQVGGTLLGNTTSYQVALLNGVPDGANTTNQDFDNDKDLDARVFVQPFAAQKGSLAQGLAAGVSASAGRAKGAGAPTAGYKTDGQQAFFKFNSTVVGDGQVWRISPQADYYQGPFSVLAEYVVSTVNVRPTATGPKAQLENKAWDAQAGWVLTGENATFAGVAPAHPFNWQSGTWGAWQVVARYADLRVDPTAFPLFAATATNAQEAAAWGAGLNWYLNRTVRIDLDYFLTHFALPTAAPSAAQILRQDERAFTTRVQLFF